MALAGGLLEKELEIHGIKVDMNNSVNEAFRSLHNDMSLAANMPAKE